MKKKRRGEGSEVRKGWRGLSKGFLSFFFLFLTSSFHIISCGTGSGGGGGDACIINRQEVAAIFVCVCVRGKGDTRQVKSRREEKEEVVYNTELSFPNRNVSFPKVLERENRREK